MLIAVLLLVVAPIAPVLPYAVPAKGGCMPWHKWCMIASGTVYCDAQKMHVPERATVTLMDWDNNEDDVAESVLRVCRKGVVTSTNNEKPRFF